MRNLWGCALLATSLVLSACGTDEAIFVTTTTIGINGETTPPNLTFAYDRYEGFFGPADKDGNMPPVVARIESNHSIVDPKVRQLYATGAAALDVTVSDAANGKNGQTAIEERRDAVANDADGDVLVGGESRVALFGVAQTSGLKVTFGPTNVVDSVVIGYKRKEASYLPLVESEGPLIGADGNVVRNADGSAKTVKKARYPSTLAALARNVAITNLSDTSEGVTQFFATGNAARNLALSQPIRSLFQRNAEAALKRGTNPDEEFVNLYENDRAYQSAVDAWVKTRSDDLAASPDEEARTLGETCKSVSRIFGLKACTPLRSEIRSIYPGVGGS